MVSYSIYSKNADKVGFEYEHIHYTLSDAKKEIKRLWKAGYPDAKGDKTKFYSNGDWVNCGEINMSGSNKTFIANSRMKGENYIG